MEFFILNVLLNNRAAHYYLAYFSYLSYAFTQSDFQKETNIKAVHPWETQRAVLQGICK